MRMTGRAVFFFLLLVAMVARYDIVQQAGRRGKGPLTKKIWQKLKMLVICC
jgi:hypothetical protein